MGEKREIEKAAMSSGLGEESSGNYQQGTEFYLDSASLTGLTPQNKELGKFVLYSEFYDPVPYCDILPWGITPCLISITELTLWVLCGLYQQYRQQPSPDVCSRQ
ncbi:hypothetical protein STEG23_017117 [Scotinomys teguina]